MMNLCYCKYHSLISKTAHLIIFAIKITKFSMRQYCLQDILKHQKIQYAQSNKYEVHQLTGSFVKPPRPRSHHISVLYKNKIYVFGGIDDKGQPNDWQFVRFYSLQTKVWEKIKTYHSQAQALSFQGRRAMYGAVVGNRFFVLGVNQEPKYNDQFSIWRLMLQSSFDWKAQQSRGEPLKPAEGGCLLSYQKNYLIFFGGHFQGDFSNIIYLYHADGKSWYQCGGNYLFSLKARAHASMSCINSKIYLFGGYYKGCESIQELNDFYEISIRLPSKGVTAQATVTKIHTICTPPTRGYHTMIPVHNSDLCIFGGKHQQDYDRSIWHFSTYSQEWTLFDEFALQQLHREETMYLSQANNVFVFGGLQLDQDQHFQLKGDLVNVKFNWNNFYITLGETHMNREESYSNICKLCYERRHNFMNHSVKFPSILISQIKQMIEFPFAAIGLLTDNSLMQGGTVVSIRIETFQNSYCIRVDDNAKNLWTEQQIIKSIRAFGAQANPITAGGDKKAKKSIQKSNMLHEFGSNLKLGCLRLGKKFLLVSNTNKQLRVIYCYQQSKEEGYIIDYYTLDTATKEPKQQWMAHSRKFIEQRYYKLIRDVHNNKNITNSVFVFETIIGDPEQHFNVSTEDNDIRLGPAQGIQTLMSMGYNISKCIDVSLKSYLSALYLRCQTLELTLKVDQTASFIVIQGGLQKVDKLWKSGAAIQLQDLFDFEFKHAQFYYLRDTKKAGNFFSNGLLLYYHNRLITRFRPKLGTLLSTLRSQKKAYFNYLPLFGYAELPDGVIVNPFKTNFCFDAMLEVMYSRFKFVQETFKKRLSWGSAPQAGIPEQAIRRRERPSQAAKTGVKQMPWRLRYHETDVKLPPQQQMIIKPGEEQAQGRRSSQLIASPAQRDHQAVEQAQARFPKLEPQEKNQKC